MSELQNGTLVQHSSLGVGKIVALEANAVHVFFPASDKKFAAKLRLPAARALLRTEGFAPDSWLDGLSTFELDPATGRYGLGATWLTHDQAVAQFLAVYPKGFADPAYLGTPDGKDVRVSRWRAAQAAFAAELGRGEAERLIEAGDLATLVRRANKIEKLVAPLNPPADVGAVQKALSEPEPAREFFAALLELTSAPAPGRARFEKLFAAARGLPVEPAQQWLVATLFPFVAWPDRHMLLRPKTTCEGASRLGSDLRFEPAPVWVTYYALRALATQLLERLKPLGAADFVDVESFLHFTATRKRQAASGEDATSAPKAGRKGLRASARTATGGKP
jgi:hypothetical protein